MAEAPKQEVASGVPKVEGIKPPPKVNPVWRMMGLPNFRFKLPSRNWMIFLTVTGSITAGITYDRRQKRLVQKKWQDLVADIAQQPLPVSNMRRKITVFIAAPPGDGIRPTREYFKEYVKPVLVAAALDYDVIEGRKEGDLRYGTAEQIRRLRRKMGELGTSPPAEEEIDVERELDKIRDKLNITMEPGIRGDLVLGRHTWKEYVRGVHEGWLGPLDEPPEPISDPQPLLETASPQAAPTSASAIAQKDESSTDEKKDDTPTEDKKEEPPKEEKKKPHPPPAYLPTAAYPSAPLSPHTPSIFEPVAPIYQQHLLGFLKTPQRLYNFFNRRKLADQIGRETAALVLTAHRPYMSDEAFASTSSTMLDTDQLATKMPENDADVVQASHTFEQQEELNEEERYWHKSVRKPKKVDSTAEKIWMSEVVLDPRIASRMRKFELDSEEEARARRIGAGEEKGRAIPAADLDKVEVVIGNLDNPND